MILHNLQLANFRSHKKATFSFSDKVTVIIGPNASGKTNILEAISLLSAGRSFRAERDTEMVGGESQLSVVSCRLSVEDSRSSVVGNPLSVEGNRLSDVNNQLSVVGGQLSEVDDLKKLEVRLTTGEVGGVKTPVKRFFVNGVPRRSVDFAGNLRTALFWPQDLELITHAPTLRRRYLDFVLTQTDREYRRSLASYEKGVRQRNRVLEKIRDNIGARPQLMFWDQLIIKTGQYVTECRSKFIAEINKTENPFGVFTVIYDPSFISEARLSQYADAEVASATTLVGPHRDDWQTLENGRDLAKFGSRGEQRLAVLWLKLAELEYISSKSSFRPLLLLDDIFSELDHAHREEVVRIASKQQTIITTADRHFLPEELVIRAKMIELK